MTLPRAAFADLADALFVAIQYEAERISVLQILQGRGALTGKGELELKDAAQRGNLLRQAFELLYALGPLEDGARRALAAILAGDDRRPIPGVRP